LRTCRDVLGAGSAHGVQMTENADRTDQFTYTPRTGGEKGLREFKKNGLKKKTAAREKEKKNPRQTTTDKGTGDSEKLKKRK